MKALLTSVFWLLTPRSGQKLDPVQWMLTSDAGRAPAGSTVPLRLTAKLDEKWHLYSLTSPKGGPIPTTVDLAESPAIESSKLFQPRPERKFDRNFNLDTETFQKEAVFWITAELKKDTPAGPAELTGQVRYQSCDDRQCLPPRKKTATFTVAIDPSAPAATAFIVPAGYTEIKPGAPAPAAPTQSDDLGAFLLTAFCLGLATIFTPCV